MPALDFKLVDEHICFSIVSVFNENSREAYLLVTYISLRSCRTTHNIFPIVGAIFYNIRRETERERRDAVTEEEATHISKYTYTHKHKHTHTYISSENQRIKTFLVALTNFRRHVARRSHAWTNSIRSTQPIHFVARSL